MLCLVQPEHGLRVTNFTVDNTIIGNQKYQCLFAFACHSKLGFVLADSLQNRGCILASQLGLVE